MGRGGGASAVRIDVAPGGFGVGAVGKASPADAPARARTLGPVSEPGRVDCFAPSESPPRTAAFGEASLSVERTRPFVRREVSRELRALERPHFDRSVVACCGEQRTVRSAHRHGIHRSGEALSICPRRRGVRTPGLDVFVTTCGPHDTTVHHRSVHRTLMNVQAHPFLTLTVNLSCPSWPPLRTTSLEAKWHAQ